MKLLYTDDAYLRDCEARIISADVDGIRLDQTVFYPTGGGQPGDSGRLIFGDGSEIAIIDTRKGLNHQDVVHIAAEGAEPPSPGTTVKAVLDWDRRYKHMRMHTTMHILCALIEGDVTGGSVGAEKSRLDFNLPDFKGDKLAISAELNRVIGEDHKVVTRWISEEELEAQPDLVRTMSVQPPRGAGKVRLLEIEDVDLQPCGGTHVASTAEIGEMVIAKIENKGRQNRRFNIRFGGSD